MDWAIVRTAFEDELYKIAEMSLAGISSETLLNYPKPEPMPSAAYEKAQAILQKVRSDFPDEVEKEASFKSHLWTAAGGLAVGAGAGAVGHHYATKKGRAKDTEKAYLLGRVHGQERPQQGVEKTSSRIRPDRMEPGPDEMLRKGKTEAAPAAQAKSFATHVIGGAGAAKFMHDWADTGRQAFSKPTTQTVGRLFKKKVLIPVPGADPKTKFIVMSSGAALGLGEYARKRIRKAHRDKHHSEGGHS
jgi:hypothetical protein